MTSTQTRRKRKVGKYLQGLRERAGITTEDAGALLRRAANQISKMENGHTLSAFAELAALLTFYGASEDERAAAQVMWDDAKQDGTRIEYSTAVNPKFRTFLRAEADADEESELAPLAVPGQLQTRGYARAVLEEAQLFAAAPANLDRSVAARLARQKLLDGPSPLRFHAIIDVAVVRRVVGGPAVMAEQLRYLLELGKRPHVTIQIVDERAGAYGNMSGPFVILRYEDPSDPATVYVEHAGGGLWVDGKADVATFVSIFENLKTRALSVAESAALIGQLAESLEGQ